MLRNKSKDYRFFKCIAHHLRNQKLISLEVLNRLNVFAVQRFNSISAQTVCPLYSFSGVRGWRFRIDLAEYCKGLPQRKLKISYKLKAGPNHLNRDRGSVKPVGNSGDVVKVRGRDLRPEVPKGHNKILRTISQFMNRLWTNFKIVYNLKARKFNTKVLTSRGFWKNEFYKVTYFGHKSVNPLL